MWFTRCFVLVNYGHDEKNIPCAGVSKALMVLCETIISLYLLNRTIVLLALGRYYHLKRADLLIVFVAKACVQCNLCLLTETMFYVTFSSLPFH